MARRGTDREGGASTVEFALVVPIVLLVMLMALDFTRALLAYTAINHGSREGVRYAVLHPDADDTQIVAYVKGRTPLSPEDLEVTAWVTSDPPSDGDDREWERWRNAERVTGPVTVRVDVEYPWEAASALVAGFFAASSQSSPLRSTSFMETRR